MFSLPGAAAFVTVVAAVAAGGNGAPAAETNERIKDSPANGTSAADSQLMSGS